MCALPYKILLKRMISYYSLTLSILLLNLLQAMGKGVIHRHSLVFFQVVTVMEVVIAAMKGK
jgi:hypothetical protein